LVATGERASLAISWQARTMEELLEAVASLVVGDGGGAVVLESSNDPGRGLRAREFRSDPTQWRHAIGGRFRPGTQACEVCGGLLDRTFRCNGRNLFAAAFGLLYPTMETVMERTGWGYDDLDVIFCHQPTKRFVEKAIPFLGDVGRVAGKLWGTAERYGNTSTTSLALAMSEAEAAGPCVKGAAFAEGGALLTVYGVDLTGDATERVYGARLEVDDPLAFHARPDSIAVARSFAATRGLRPGDRLELTTPAGRRAFTVRGLLDAGGVARAYAGNVAVMDIHAAEQLFPRRGLLTGRDGVVAPEADLRHVAEAIARRLPAGLRVGATAERQADLRGVTELLRTALQALGLFGLVAAFLITFNRLSTVFEERAWQLGVLRAVGVRTSAV